MLKQLRVKSQMIIYYLYFAVSFLYTLIVTKCQVEIEHIQVPVILKRISYILYFSITIFEAMVLWTKWTSLYLYPCEYIYSHTYIHLV